MNSSGNLARRYKRRDPENQYPVMKVDMSWRTKEEWAKLLKQARQIAVKNVYDPRYEKE